jgi:hypothetical protein
MSDHYSVTQFPDEPILLVEFLEGFSLGRHLIQLDTDLKAALNNAPQPMYMVYDGRNIHVSFDDLTHATSNASRGEGNIMHHPNLAKTIVITNNAMVKLALKGMKAEIFGHVNAVAFDTMEEALAHARELVRASA